MYQRGKVAVLVFLFSICATATWLNYQKQLKTEQLQPSELFEVVHQQLQAFKSNNFAAAYGQASASFQQRWSLEQFSGMIRTNYGRVSKAESVEFGSWQRRGRRAMLQVFFINRDGSVSPCIYTFVTEGEGWKIDGTRWLKGWPYGQRMRGVRA